MNDIFSYYTGNLVLSGDMRKDIYAFFSQNNDLRTLNHTLEVRDEGRSK